ncbi:MAG: D-glycero-alpha-D-manno-heptose-1,7-bisphosphate 7-phosphatase [Nitrospinota bacterium]
MTQSKAAIFLDRDGCINVESNYITDISMFKLYDGALDAIRKINNANFYTVVVTNQGGVAKGLTSLETVAKVHQLLLKWCFESSVVIDRIEFCPHHPDADDKEFGIICNCRKPATGMALKAAEELSIDILNSYVIGDKLTDIELAKNLGCRSILVRTGFGARDEKSLNEKSKIMPDFIADDIGDAVDLVLKNSNG